MKIRTQYVAGFLLIAALGVAMTAPSFNAGFSSDDHFMRALYKHFPGLDGLKRGPLETFSFSKGIAGENEWLRDKGVFPWWAVTNAKLTFFRPLASLTHWFDYTRWPENPAPMHAQNILWYGLACGLIFVLLRELSATPWVATFGAILYAINESNGLAVGWISSRNTLMVTAFTALVLIAHHRWRVSQKDRWATAALFFYGLGLLCGEGTISVCTFLFAYAVILDRGTWRTRMLSLAPCALVTAGYLILYRMSGYGSAGSGWYTDPGADFPGWLRMLSTNIPVLLFSEFVTWPSPLFTVNWPYNALYFAILLALLGILGVLLLPLLRTNARARFWLAAAVLSLLPVSSVVAQPRVLTISAIAALALVAEYLSNWFNARQFAKLAATVIVMTIVVRVGDSVLRLGYALYPIILGLLAGLLFWLLRTGEKADWVKRAHPARRFCSAALMCVWVIAHVIVAPNALPNSVLVNGATDKKMAATFATLPPDEIVFEKTLILLQTSNDFSCYYLSLMRSGDARTSPKHLRALSASLRDMTLERPDALTLILRTEDGFVADRETSIYRSAKYPMHDNEKVALTGMTVTVNRVDAQGWPMDATFVFDKPLEDDNYLWYTSAIVPERNARTGRKVFVERYFAVSPPAVGEKIHIGELLQCNPKYHSLTAAPSNAAPPTKP